MRYVKGAEQVGKERGYSNTSAQYAAAAGVFGGKIQLIAMVLDKLWSTPGIEKEDALDTLRDINNIIKDVVE